MPQKQVSNYLLKIKFKILFILDSYPTKKKFIENNEHFLSQKY